MKKCLVLLAAVSCQMLGMPETADEKGELRISFNDSHLTKVVEEIPDTSDFLLTVSAADGTRIYDGPYGDSPESIMADVPSKTALATSVISARVGVGLVIIDSSIWVAVMTIFPS